MLWVTHTNSHVLMRKADILCTGYHISIYQ